MSLKNSYSKIRKQLILRTTFVKAYKYCYLIQREFPQILLRVAISCNVSVLLINVTTDIRSMYKQFINISFVLVQFDVTSIHRYEDPRIHMHLGINFLRRRK